MKFLILLLLFLFSASSAYAANSYTVAAGATVTIDEHGTCKKVKNTGTVSRMVPTKSAAEWTSFQNNPNGMTLSTCACTFSTWTAIGPTGKYWNILGVSENGQVLAAIDTEPTLSIDDNETGQIYISTNGGSTWTARGGPTMLVSDFDMSDDGTTMFFAGTDNGYPNGYNNYFVSTNSGTSWTKRTNADPGLGVAVSGNGAMIALAEYWDAGNIRSSSNDGSTWTSRRGKDNYYDIDISETGSTMAAAVYGAAGRIYVSTNTGSTWTARGPAQTWMYVGISDDGSTIVAHGINPDDSSKSGLYISTNSGSTFTQAFSNPLGFYASRPSLSKDGTTVAITGMTYNADFSSSTSEVKITTNGGSSWLSRHPINNTARNLGTTVVSGNGQIVYTYLHGTVPSGGYLPDPGRMYKSTCN